MFLNQNPRKYRQFDLNSSKLLQESSQSHNQEPTLNLWDQSSVGHRVDLNHNPPGEFITGSFESFCRDNLAEKKQPLARDILNIDQKAVNDRKGTNEEVKSQEKKFKDDYLKQKEELFQKCVELAVCKYRGFLRDDAFHWLKKAQREAEDLEIDEGNADNFRKMYCIEGGIQMMDGKLRESEIALDKAAEILERYFTGCPNETMYTNTIRGKLYIELGDFLQAEALLVDCAKLRESNEKKENLAMAYIQLAELYVKWEKWDQAEENLEKIQQALVHASESNQKIYTGRYFRILGKMHFKREGRSEEGKEAYEIAIDLLTNNLPEKNYWGIKCKKEYEEFLEKELLSQKKNYFQENL